MASALKGLPDQRPRRGGNRVVTLLLVGLLAMVGVGLWASLSGGPAQPGAVASPGPAGQGQVVREDSHRLGPAAPDGKVTFVEFLDFECEGCRAAYPVVEQLRQQYEGRVTFVLRYFPLPGHFNSERAARAVEAAARQGQLEAMYQQMYETQTQWGEQQVPADATFREMAAGLGLDMARWDADYASPEVAARVQQDLADANALGLSGTPSFFLNGQPLQPESAEDLTRALDQALAQ